jgi:hypothetical protein
MKVARDMTEDAPEETLAFIIKNQCLSLTDNLRNENLAFFLEALTPAFAAFWTICNISMMTGKDMKEKAKTMLSFVSSALRKHSACIRPYPFSGHARPCVTKKWPIPCLVRPPCSALGLKACWEERPLKSSPPSKLKREPRLSWYVNKWYWCMILMLLHVLFPLLVCLVFLLSCRFVADMEGNEQISKLHSSIQFHALSILLF